MKCPSTTCVFRSRDDGECIAPIDERVRRHCPLPKDYQHRLKMCGAKKRYLSRQEASRDQQKLSMDRDRLNNYNVYLCPYCQHWHIGGEAKK